MRSQLVKILSYDKAVPVCCTLILFFVALYPFGMLPGRSGVLIILLWHLCLLFVLVFLLIFQLSLKCFGSLVYLKLTLASLVIQLVQSVLSAVRLNSVLTPFSPVSNLILIPLSIFSLAVAAILLFALSGKYHRAVPVDAQGALSELDMQKVLRAKTCYIYRYGDLYLFFPQYQNVEFVFGKQPSPRDSRITFCLSAAFFTHHGARFSHKNIVGEHCKNGVYYEGSSLKDLGVFSFYDGVGHFESGKSSEKAVRLAAAHGGDAFSQYVAIWDGEIKGFRSNRWHCQRVLTEINGRLCIVDSAEPVSYDSFIRQVQALGVKHALYMDTGFRGNYSWYRESRGKVRSLFGLPYPLQNNWLIFCQQQYEKSP